MMAMLTFFDVVGKNLRYKICTLILIFLDLVGKIISSARVVNSSTGTEDLKPMDPQRFQFVPDLMTR